MKDVKLVSTPLGSHFQLYKEQSPTIEATHAHMDRTPYAYIVYSHTYAMVCTIPDIAHIQ